MQLPPPDAILGSVNKDFEECNPIKCFQDKHDTDHIQNKVLTSNSKAFTLAEVLITLVVIGVIAAITVPTLMANYKKQEASARIKKFYSTLQQVVTKAKADGNDWEDWADRANASSDYTSTSIDVFSKKYLLPYISYHKTLFKEDRYEYIYFNDGSYFYIKKGTCMDFTFDVNGDKKPNISGRDQFRFLYCPYSQTFWKGSGKIVPYQQTTMTTRVQIKSACINDGSYCSALLLYDNWEFKSDYPYKI